MVIIRLLFVNKLEIKSKNIEKINNPHPLGLDVLRII